MPSARSITQLPLGAVGVAGAVATAGLLAGCTSTQTVAARERLNSSRQVAAQSSTIVHSAGGVVDVTKLAVVKSVRTSPRSAVVVSLTNTTTDDVSDLPISVGYTLADKRVYLNASESLGYFQSHLPLVTAHGHITWIFSSSRAIPAAAKPFALVGASPTVSTGPIAGTPEVGSTALSATGGTLKVRVHNTSGVPQYQLPVYAYASHAGRVAAAGNMTVSYIGSGSIQTVKIHIAGTGTASDLQTEALPTTFK